MESMKNLRGRIPSVLLAALVLALSRLQSTGAVDILFWSQAHCQGTYKGWLGLAEGTCLCGGPYGSATPSVQVSKSSSSIWTRIYTGDSCLTEWGGITGNICFTGAQFTGARWNTIVGGSPCNGGSSSCKKVMDPNAVGYNSGEGNWVLINDNAMGLYEQLTNVPDSEKVAWLTAQGASYSPKPEEKIIVVANSYDATSAL